MLDYYPATWMPIIADPMPVGPVLARKRLRAFYAPPNPILKGARYVDGLDQSDFDLVHPLTTISPTEALRAATLAPAEYLEAGDTMGTIAVGHVADMVLLRSNPLENIGATREIEAVLLRGRVLDRRRLDELLDATERVAQGGME